MFSWPITVYYEDTDVGGVVYHANYLKFFERARSEWFKSFGVNQTKLMEEDISFVVSNAEIRFLKPARFEQELTVESSVSDIKRVSLVFNQKLFDQTQQCYCEAKITVVCIRLSTMKPCNLPSFILEELQSAR